MVIDFDTAKSSSPLLKITTFKVVPLFACAGLFERTGSGLELLKFTFNAENSYT